LAIHGRSNRIELPHVIGPGEFNLKSAASAIITNTADLNVFHRLTLDVQRFNAMNPVADPIPIASAPVEIGVEIVTLVR
jgi:hypothetical protein